MTNRPTYVFVDDPYARYSSEWGKNFKNRQCKIVTFSQNGFCLVRFLDTGEKITCLKGSLKEV